MGKGGEMNYEFMKPNVFKLLLYIYICISI